jgi:orotate phosphoribosyltransferase
MFNFRQDFIRFAVGQKVLRFGEFQTKAGRLSPYFFNAGLFNDGDSLRNLSQFYAQAIQASQIPFDMLFGPAYKGIPLAAGAAIATSPIATTARRPRITARVASRWAQNCRGAC